MKADKNFRLSKEVKRMLGSFTDKAARRQYLNAMINAQLSYENNGRAILGQREKDAS